jgi:dynein light intermediate chain 1
MLIVILLDWEHPWLWLRQLRDWIRVLRSLVSSLDDESKDVMEENINAWRDRHRGLGGSSDTTGSGPSDTAVLPLGQGEWDEPLGIPLCVVCQNADKIEGLERERGWKEEEFDFVLQYLRTVLLKHGASLIYTMNSAPGPLQTLIHSSLGIKSMLKQKQLKHNVIDRDHILIPPNWDSWGKIRILREGFDVEGVSQAWSEEIQTPLPPPPKPEVISNGKTAAETEPETETGELVSAEPEPSPEPEKNITAVSVYEDTIRDPEQDSALSALNSKNSNGLEIPSTEAQAFLTSQVEILDRLRLEDDREKKGADKKRGVATYISQEDASGVVEEHIGPVQFNMGGIQVNADEMVKRLQVLRAHYDLPRLEKANTSTPGPRGKPLIVRRPRYSDDANGSGSPAVGE